MEEVNFPPQGTVSEGAEKRTVLALAKGSAIGLLGRLLGRFLMLIYQALLARSLGRDQYGLFSLGWSVLQISIYMGPVGMQQAILRFASPLWKKDEVAFRRVLQQSLVIAASTGFFLGGVLFFASPALAALFQKPALLLVWRAIALALFLSVLLRVLSAMTRISQKVQFSLLVEDVLLPFSMALATFFLTVIWHWGIQGALLSVIFGYTLMVWLGMVFVKILFPSAFVPVRWEREVFRSLSLFSLPTSLGTLFNLLTQWMPRLILGYFRPEAEVGLYQAAFQVATLPALILASTGPIFIPIIARLIGERKFQEVNDVYVITTKWTAYISAPLVVTLFFFPRISIYLFFGTEYEGATTMLLILLGAQTVNILTGGVFPLHIMSGHQNRALRISGLAFVVTLLLAIWWTHWWGGLGTALATAIGISLSNIVALFSIKQLAGYWPFDRRYWKGGVALISTLFATVLMTHWNIGYTLQFAISLLVNILVFIGVVWALGFDREERVFFDGMRGKLGQWLAKSNP